MHPDYRSYDNLLIELDVWYALLTALEDPEVAFGPSGLCNFATQFGLWLYHITRYKPYSDIPLVEASMRQRIAKHVGHETYMALVGQIAPRIAFVRETIKRVEIEIGLIANTQEGADVCNAPTPSVNSDLGHGALLGRVQERE